jgi:N-acetylated-alpha-linked acidic dipeptidase
VRITNLLSALALPVSVVAQTSTPVPATPGYSATAAARQRALERDAISRPDPKRARDHAFLLARETHVAGTQAQARTRDYVLAQMKSWGLETEAREYEVYLPHPTSARVWRVAPSPRELALREPPVRGDSYSTGTQWPTVNGYSAAGDTSGEIVFANYGLIEDYAQLDSMGVSVRGKIVVARYGRSFRGIKAREAEKHGAVALILYSDPQEDGYVRGDVYPSGPMRSPGGVQRGSVMNGVGDPSTPGWPSTRGARRIPVDSMPIPRIPVVAMGYDNAAELLRGLRGNDVPQSWQGGLPFRYHVGPGPVRARVQVRDDRAARPYKAIWNTLGVIRGSELPDELVVIGAHRDAWSPGAVDNVSGTVSVLEAARAIAELTKAGQGPRRTIVFATWDAEEWGLIGSTEHVEDDSLRLMRGGVAYLNQDVAASGVRFGGGGSPSLRGLLRDVANAVPDPNGRGSVYAEWRRQSAVADTAEPAMGDPGGGSDFAGFYNHLGIPHADWGFGGPGGIYHSQYDDLAWMTRFGDTSYAYHAAAARIAAAMALRLANAQVLPYDYAEFARTMMRYVDGVDRAIAARRWTGDDLSTASLRSALQSMGAEARRFQTYRDSVLSSGNGVSRSAADRANLALRSVERSLTRPEGLRTRPWYRSLVYVADEDNGYSTMVFPSVLEAVRTADRSLTARELADLAQRFRAATAAIVAAREALGR